jgi:hypothetical protein
LGWRAKCLSVTDSQCRAVMNAINSDGEANLSKFDHLQRGALIFETQRKILTTLKE